MVDADIKATGWIFLIDLSIFLFYLLVFFAIRGTRGDKDVMLPNWKGGDRELSNARFTSKDLRPSIAEEIEESKSHDSSFNNITLAPENHEFRDLSIINELSKE